MNTTISDRLQLGGWLRLAVALALLALISVAPLYTNSQALPAPADAPAAGPEPAAPPGPAQDSPGERSATPESRALTEYLARRYRLDAMITGQLVRTASDAGEQVGLDPLLILAVIAIESRFNPIAESFIGAKGLMQVVPAMHGDKLGSLGGAQAMLDPMLNIHVGARILSEYIHREGSLEAGLQSYNGAASDATASYAKKVLAEEERLRQAVREKEGGNPA
jgi:soluble lytic murein transglycosylase-like protein